MKVGLNSSNIMQNVQQRKDEQNQILDKLSSGKEDKSIDPAMAMIANAMMSDILSDTQGLKNVNSASAMMQIADGALSQASEMSSKLQELSVASNNAALGTQEQNALRADFNATVDTINQTISSTTYNSKPIFGEDMKFSFGKGELSVSLSELKSGSLSIDSQDSIDDFAKNIQRNLSEVGSMQNSLRSTANNLMESITQKSATKSNMSDADMAELISSFEQNEVKLDAALFVSAHQKNISAQRIATLLD